MILDKSALEMLGQEEARWLDHYYFLNVVPPLFAEIHMDLAKTKLPEDKRRVRVAALAAKIGVTSSGTNHHHEDLVVASLLGHAVRMEQKVLLRPDKVHTDEFGRQTAWLGQSKVEQALQRWRTGVFNEEDMSVGARLRSSRDDFDLDPYLRMLRGSNLLKDAGARRDYLGLLQGLQKGLFHTKEFEEHIESCMRVFRVREEEKGQIWKRWNQSADKYFLRFAPYAYYCYVVRSWFLLLISEGGYSPSTHSFSDLEYLYYLPFCSVFVSRDKLHHKLAAPLLKATQVLADAEELKSDLAAIDAHWEKSHEAVRQLGSMTYAKFPPDLHGSLTCKLWDKFVPRWRRDREEHWNEVLETLVHHKS